MFRKLTVCALLLLLVVPSIAYPRGHRAAAPGSDVPVSGYTKADGTYVAPHTRSAPDGSFYNNWSTKGNYNPYTGADGTRITPPNGYYGGASGGYQAIRPQATYNPIASMMDRWIGQPIGNVTSALGSPYKTHSHNGGRSFEYKNGKSRFEYFFDASNHITQWKMWSY